MQPPPAQPGIPRAHALGASGAVAPTRPGTEKASAVFVLPQLSHATEARRSDMLRIAWERLPHSSQTYS